MPSENTAAQKLKWWQWGVIAVITMVIFYVCYPKYYFHVFNGGLITRCNKITGEIDRCEYSEGCHTISNIPQKP